MAEDREHGYHGLQQNEGVTAPSVNSLTVEVGSRQGLDCADNVQVDERAGSQKPNINVPTDIGYSIMRWLRQDARGESWSPRSHQA